MASKPTPKSKSKSKSKTKLKPKTKPRSRLTLHDLLSRLTTRMAEKLLGPMGKGLLVKAGREQIDIDTQVLFTATQFQVVFPVPQVVVTLSVNPRYVNRLQVACSHASGEGLYYQAATLSLVLEEKTSLGLAVEPNHDVPWELMPDAELESRAIAEREKRAEEEVMKIKPADISTPWTDYLVTSAGTGKSYRVALRGMERGQSYCSCPDFRKNRLGLCKHSLKVRDSVERRFKPAELKKAAPVKELAIYVRYVGDPSLGLEAPKKLSEEARALVEPWAGRFAATDAEIQEMAETVRKLSLADVEFRIYPDAEELLNHVIHRVRMAEVVGEIRKSPATHPLRKTLLKTELLPYQLDGIAFAAGAGRAVLADEMGLGKTIQGVGVAEFLARSAGVGKVLVVCPASLKSQWMAEISRFSDRTVQIVAGATAERTDQYATGAFFTICNYEQVLRDYLDIERTHWDLIILDEAQRIKNWEAKTSRVIKSLRSTFALVLTGTPLENRLDDLYSVVEFIDDRRLGPAYQFVHGHRVVSETGKVLGYKNLDTLRARLAPILLRRTRASISLDLPPRATEIVRIAATDEQLALHSSHMNIVRLISGKPFLTEVDLMRLQKALLMARMSANSTQLVDRVAPGFSSKLDRLAELLEQLIGEPERKIIIFSEWTRMLDLVEPMLNALGAKFVRLDGSVTQKKRQMIVNEFQNKPECRCFITTNAGSTGLNLQSADTVINLDLPWNPALLEQRIARAHRMGQKRKVQVYILITEGTMEENLLATLGAKHELAAAVLDPDSDLREIQLASGLEELRRRLEILLGAKPEAETDISVEQAVAAAIAPEPDPAAAGEQKAKISAAGGQLFTSAFAFLSQVLPGSGPAGPDDATVAAVKHGLEQCVTLDADGNPQLTLTLPGADALDAMAKALAAMMGKAVGI